MSERRRKRKSRRDQLRNSALSELGSTGLELLSHGKVKVGKRMSQEDRERTQARVGLVSNVLGLAAAGAATGAALKNPALRRPSKADPGPVSGRVLRAANKGRFGRVGRVLRSPRGRAALIAGGAGSALGLQLANLGGDVVANRVLSREAGVSKKDAYNKPKGALGAASLGVSGAGLGAFYQRMYGDMMNSYRDSKSTNPKVSALVKPPGMPMSEARRILGTRTAAELKARGVAANLQQGIRRAGSKGGKGAAAGLVGGALLGSLAGFQKSEFSMISKSDEVRVTGHGVNIEKRNPLGVKRVTDAARSAVWHQNRRGLFNSKYSPEGLTGTLTGIHRHMSASDAAEKVVGVEARKLRNKSLIVGGVGGSAATGAVMYAANRNKSEVKKRNFNAEADRQRRLGLYAGAGIGGGLVAGDAARKVVLANSKKIKDLYDIPDKRIANKRVYRLPKRRLDRVGLAALAAGSVLGVGGGLAAYKRGIDERNNPWG